MIESLMCGGLFYFIAFIFALWCYKLYSPLYQRTCFVIALCAVGHYFGTYMFSLTPTDSELVFFANASPTFSRLGTEFVNTLTWYVRDWFTGDDYLSTLYFFSAFSFLGSVMWYLLFLQLAKTLEISNQKRMYPALVIMCWPSYLFFTAGIGKDSLSFFFIPIVILTFIQFYYQKQNRILNFAVMMFSLVVLSMIRPYLAMIAAGAFILTNVQIKITAGRVFLVLASLPIVYYVVLWVITTQTNMSEISVLEIAQKAQEQQEYLSSGTSFPRFSSNPIVVLMLLPYSFLMNLIMPLFVLSNNSMGMLASIENSYLVWLIYKFFSNRRVYAYIKAQLPAVKLCFYFFLVGMSFLGLINTNLGLATRQKSMYVPAFLVVTMLIWLFNKQKRRLHRSS